MRSIRVSLIVYFLVLLALALGGVSWFVYQITAKALRDNHATTADLIHDKYRYQCDEKRAELDRHILSQALMLSRRAQSSSVHFEYLYSLGIMTAPTMPSGYLTMPLWVAEGMQPYLSFRLYKMRPLDIIIDTPEDVLPFPEEDQPQEYFQTYRARTGQVLQRSESLGEHRFTLADNLRENLELLVEHFDDVELAPGKKLRRVTLKTIVPRFRASTLPFAWRMMAFGPKGMGKEFGTKGAPRVGFKPDAKGPSPITNVFESAAPVMFIQYASDIGPLEKRLAQFKRERDEQLEQLDEDTRAALAGLRTRLLWICAGTFAGIFAGGFLLIRLGLAPLARLSEAVSEVSEKDFRLKVDQAALPAELQPIAARLSQTLSQLQQAFAREKQAAADISHELRTPLAAMMTNLEIALRKSRSAVEYRELLQDIHASGEQMTHLVERLLALARLDAGADRLRPRALDAAELTRQCARLVSPLAEARGLALRVHAAEPIPVEADADKLREILNNLLHNAVEYNRPEGSIDVSAQRVNGHLRLEVRDTGIGISPEARAHIFERFYRADPSRHADTPHAGLGLAIVKSYVDLMGGAITVDSNAQGSTFVVEVPASSSPA